MQLARHVFAWDAWGEGPWQAERRLPDLIEFRQAGLPCLVRRGPSGVWCGYVGVPPGHPDHGKGKREVPVEVHGGVTFASPCSEVACHEPAPGEADDFWWVGFDCGQAGDLDPQRQALERRMEPLELPGAAYRTVTYAIVETRGLAIQLAGRARQAVAL